MGAWAADGQRQGEVDEPGRCVEQQLEDDMQGEPLSDQLIGVDPEELHIEEEQGHQESHHEGTHERSEQKSGGALHG